MDLEQTSFLKPLVTGLGNLVIGIFKAGEFLHNVCKKYEPEPGHSLLLPSLC